MSGGSGDADLYTRFGSQPTTSSYDCRPYASGNNESCPVASSALYGGSWLPTRYEDVTAIAHDVEHFSSKSVSVVAPDPEHAGTVSKPRLAIAGIASGRQSR